MRGEAYQKSSHIERQQLLSKNNYDNSESVEEFLYYSQVVATDLVRAAAHKPGVYSATTDSEIRTMEEKSNKGRNSERTEKENRNNIDRDSVIH